MSFWGKSNSVVAGVLKYTLQTIPEVRCHPQSGWIDEVFNRLKGDQPIKPNVVQKRASVS